MLKKFLLLVLLCLTGILYAAPSKNGYAIYPEEPIDYIVIADEFDFTMDKVIDTDIAEQLYIICDSFLPYDENAESNILYLNVSVTQRSFFYKIEQKNAIFVVYVLMDEDENILLQKGFYYETKNTVVSSKEQYNISKRIINDVKSYVNKCSKIKVKK